MEQQPSKRQRTQPPACPLQQQQQQQQQQQAGAAAGEGAGEDPPRVWLPEVVHHVSRFLSSNERACTLRLVNKATAAQFRGPLHTTVRLSLPVPHHAFMRRWGSLGATRSLALRQRAQLPRLTARSGSIANLEVLLAQDDLSSPLDCEVLEAAAGAGQLAVCRWLRQQGCPVGRYALKAAAESGHTEVCVWLLAEGCPHCCNAMQQAAGGGHRAVCECLLASGYSVDLGAAPAAARGGHADLMDWLLARTTLRGWDVMELLEAAAAGCELPTLQRLHHDYLDARGTELCNVERERSVGAAAGSPMADWRDKVEWLEGRDFPQARRSCAAAAQQLDGRERLEWLQRRGYPLTVDAAKSAAQLGNADALEFLLGQGVQLDVEAARIVVNSAARGGHLAALKVLRAHSYGHFMDRTTVEAAAGYGHLAVVAWLVEMLGAAVALRVNVFASAAFSGNVELLAWLHDHGCPWDASVLAMAAGMGSEEQLEWLVGHGCPMGDDGRPYRQALHNADLAMLRCLRRLGCPWGPSGCIEAFFTETLSMWHNWDYPGRRKQLLLIHPWLVEQGCTFNWVSMRRTAEEKGDSELLALVGQLDQAPKWVRGGRLRASQLEKAVGKQKEGCAVAAGSRG